MPAPMRIAYKANGFSVMVLVGFISALGVLMSGVILFKSVYSGITISGELLSIITVGGLIGFGLLLLGGFCVVLSWHSLDIFSLNTVCLTGLDQLFGAVFAVQLRSYKNKLRFLVSLPITF